MLWEDLTTALFLLGFTWVVAVLLVELPAVLTLPDRHQLPH